MDVPAPSPSRANLVLATLFLGMFVIGGTELLAVGVLDLIAADLRVSIPAAGLLVTVYALGLAVGGPVLTAATIRLDKRTVLAGALALFIVSNLVAVLTGSYGLLLVARTLTGAFQGLFIAAAFAAGTAVVPPARAGRAMAVVGTAGVAGCLLALYLVGAVPVLVALALLAVGGFAMGMAPSMQYRVVSLAGPGGAFAQSLPASAANVGIALGSFAGGAAVGAFNTSAAVIAGLVIAVIAIPVAWATSFLTPPAVEMAPAPPPIRQPALCQA